MSEPVTKFLPWQFCIVSLFRTPSDMTQCYGKPTKILQDGLCMTKINCFEITVLARKLPVRIQNRRHILELLYDLIDCWNTETTRESIVDLIWRPSAGKEVTWFVKSCNGCQKSKTILKYRTRLKLPLTRILYMFSIDTAGSLPLKLNRSKYILLALKHPLPDQLDEWVREIPQMMSFHLLRA